MVDIQTVSIAIASASVVAGIVYYAFQVRHQIKIRQTDLLIRLYSTIDSMEFLEAWEKVNARQVTDVDAYKEKYGWAEFNKVVLFFDEIGVLLQRGLVDIASVDALFHQHVIIMWEKLKPLIEGGRKKLNMPQGAQGFEYLRNEMKKREQRK